MKIYVAGEVPRANTSIAGMKSVFGLAGKAHVDSLNDIYSRIETAAAAVGERMDLSARRGLELTMPYLDSELDALEPKRFVEYLREEIARSDAVLAVFCPPGIATAFEILIAAQLRKPQIILVPRSLAIPRYLRTLPNVLKIDALEDVEFFDILTKLTASMRKPTENTLESEGWR